MVTYLICFWGWNWVSFLNTFNKCGDGCMCVWVRGEMGRRVKWNVIVSLISAQVRSYHCSSTLQTLHSIQHHAMWKFRVHGVMNTVLPFYLFQLPWIYEEDDPFITASRIDHICIVNATSLPLFFDVSCCSPHPPGLLAPSSPYQCSDPLLQRAQTVWTPLSRTLHRSGFEKIAGVYCSRRWRVL